MSDIHQRGHLRCMMVSVKDLIDIHVGELHNFVNRLIIHK